MVNFRDPAVVDKHNWDLIKFSNVIDGLFFWEFLTTLHYEWSVIKGHRPYRWTIWVYSLTRVAALVAVTLDIVTLNITTPVNCQLETIFLYILGYLALAPASLLIVLRIVAIWNRHRFVVAIAFGTWGLSLPFSIQGIWRVRAALVPETGVCVMVEIEGIRLSTLVMLVTDMVLLLIMLFGLFRLRRDAGGSMALGRLLWNQGVIWLVLAIIAEVTPTVFIWLNLNDPLNFMFQVPWMVTITISATRMYRSLSDFGSSDVYISDQSLPVRGQPMSAIRGTGATRTPLPCIQVTVHTTHEHHPTKNFDNMDKVLRGTPRSQSIASDGIVENGGEV